MMSVVWYAINNYNNNNNNNKNNNEFIVVATVGKICRLKSVEKELF